MTEAEKDDLLRELYDALDTWRYRGGQKLIYLGLGSKLLTKLHKAVHPDELTPWWVK